MSNETELEKATKRLDQALANVAAVFDRTFGARAARKFTPLDNGRGWLGCHILKGKAQLVVSDHCGVGRRRRKLCDLSLQAKIAAIQHLPQLLTAIREGIEAEVEKELDVTRNAEAEIESFLLLFEETESAKN